MTTTHQFANKTFVGEFCDCGHSVQDHGFGFVGDEDPENPSSMCWFSVEFGEYHCKCKQFTPIKK